jgi:hypothetical protein
MLSRRCEGTGSFRTLLRSDATDFCQLNKGRYSTQHLLPESRIEQYARRGYCEALLATSFRHPTLSRVLTPQAALAEVNDVTHDGHNMSELSANRTDD